MARLKKWIFVQQRTGFLHPPRKNGLSIIPGMTRDRRPEFDWFHNRRCLDSPARGMYKSPSVRSILYSRIQMARHVVADRLICTYVCARHQDTPHDTYRRFHLQYVYARQMAFKTRDDNIVPVGSPYRGVQDSALTSQIVSWPWIQLPRLTWRRSHSMYIINYVRITPTSIPEFSVKAFSCSLTTTTT